MMIGVGHTSRLNVSRLIFLSTVRVAHFITVGVLIGSSPELRCVPRHFLLLFYFFSLSSIFTNYKEREKKRNKKQNFRGTSRL